MLFSDILYTGFDSCKGDYVKQFIPELLNVPKKYIHNPWEMSENDQKKYNCYIGKNYPFPIVDLKETRNRALTAFKTIN